MTKRRDTPIYCNSRRNSCNNTNGLPRWDIFKMLAVLANATADLVDERTDEGRLGPQGAVAGRHSDAGRLLGDGVDDGERGPGGHGRARSSNCEATRI